LISHTWAQTYLEGEFVLFLIREEPHFGGYIAQIVLHKGDGCIELGAAGLLVLIWLLVLAIVAA